jgi:predicted O-methyltransferase YrrM
MIKAAAVKVAKAHKGATLIVDDSVKAAGKIADGALDFVFIDGDHSYEGVKRDLAAWLPKVKPGGWLMGHDYGNKPDGGVKRAVDELGKPIELDCDHVWAVRI